MTYKVILVGEYVSKTILENTNKHTAEWMASLIGGVVEEYLDGEFNRAYKPGRG